MFNLKKLIILAVSFLGITLFFNSGEVYAVNCPAGNTVPSNWGMQYGGLEHTFASVAVYAHNASNGKPLDVSYRLNSDVERGYNYGPAPPGVPSSLYPSARIFKYPVPGSGRTDQRWFNTGGTLTAPAGTCPGWDELGPGTSSNIGNGFILDCQEVDVNGNKHNNRFWIDAISTPTGADGRYGGHWTVKVSTGGEPLQNRNFPMSYNNAFSVINGQNARINLVWHPNPPPPPPGPAIGRCERLEVNGWGAYDTNNTNGAPRWRPTQTLVRVTDANGNVIVPESGDKKTANGAYALLEGGPGPPGYNESKTWHYKNKVKTKNITIQVIRKWHKRNGPNFFWHEEINNTNSYNCYNASCDLSIVGNVPGRSNGVQSRSGFSVTAHVRNNSTPEATEPLPALVDGRPLVLASNPGTPVGFWYNPAAPNGIPRNTDEWNTWNVVEPGWNIGSYGVGATLYYDFDPSSGIQAGDLVIANCVPANYEVYKPFQLTPVADVQLNPSPEDLSEVRYTGTAGGTVPDYPGGIDVNYSSLEQSTPFNGGTSSVNHAGVGHTNIVHGHSSPPIAPTRAGDRYNMQFCIGQANGLIGPGNKFSSDTYGACASSHANTHDRPYLRAYGGDVQAGNVCGLDPDSGEIKTYVSPHSTKTGSGGQLGAFAPKSIEEFISASLRYSLATPRPAKGLTFANVGAGVGPYGGNFEAGVCATNYFGSRDANAETIANNNGLPDIKNRSGKFNADDDVTLGNGNNVSGQKAIYVDGNVYINQNITYLNPGNYSSVENIPRFTLIVTGNIYIDKDVTRLDGTFVAGGKISTCASGFQSYPNSQLWDNCRANQLTVYGAFMAPEIEFLRTKGSLRDSLRSNDGQTRANAGEIFIYSPEVFLAPLLPGANGAGGGEAQIRLPDSYDAITTLPPIL